MNLPPDFLEFAEWALIPLLPCSAAFREGFVEGINGEFLDRMTHNPYERGTADAEAFSFGAIAAENAFYQAQGALARHISRIGFPGRSRRSEYAQLQVSADALVADRLRPLLDAAKIIRRAELLA